MPSPKNVFALLIGINDYPEPVSSLLGCRQDIESVQEYLHTYFNTGPYQLHLKTLTDGEATRANIIDGFNLFAEARDGDICYVHYSGHGARAPVLEEFKEVETDSWHETLVCYDSRLEGGRDLLDKELSYLIWKATADKDLHFLAVLDCCHSGTATRLPYCKARQADRRKDQLKAEDLLGFEQFKRVGERSWSPPRGKHVLLAAAQPKQLAKEVHANNRPCGIFTYCLLDALKAAQNQISYLDLMARVNLRVANKVSDQSPQLESIVPEDKHLQFLSGNPFSEARHYLVSYDKQNNSWMLNAGALHGIVPGSPGNDTLVELLETGQEAKVGAVGPKRAHLKALSGLDPERQYQARITRMALPKTRVAFAPDNEPEAELPIREHLKDKTPPFYTLSEDAEQVGYLIHAKNGAYYLGDLDGPLEKDEKGSPKDALWLTRVEGYAEPSARRFLQILEKVCRWTRYLELTNPEATSTDSLLQIKLYRAVEPPPDYNNDVPTELLDYHTTNVFAYSHQDEKWCMPALQLRMKNTSDRPLWVSVLYFTYQYGITHHLLPKQCVEPGEEARVRDIPPNGFEYLTIPLKMEDGIHQRGIFEIREYLKVMVSTDEFDTETLCQKDLPLQRSSEPTRSAHRRGHYVPAWWTREIPMVIRRPKEARETNHNDV